jgi:RND superfamily putative drug exporter
VTRDPRCSRCPSSRLLLVIASPLLGVTFGTPDQGVLRSTSDSRRVADALVTDFPGNASAPIEIVTTGPVAPEPLASYAPSALAATRTSRASLPCAARSGNGQSLPAVPSLGNGTGERLTVTTTFAGQDRRADSSSCTTSGPWPGRPVPSPCS